MHLMKGIASNLGEFGIHIFNPTGRIRDDNHDRALLHG